jgi:hypothetical protein
VILAQLEFFHSRAIAPTRRVALGDSDLPCDPAPGFGGVLLGGVVAANWPRLAEDSLPDVTKLAKELEEGRRIPQPRLRHRFQVDRVGLLRTRVQLVRRTSGLDFDLSDQRSMPAQRILAALYAAGALPSEHRRVVFGAINRALRWQGPIGQPLIAALSGTAGGHQLSTWAMDDPVGWARRVLGFEVGETGGPMGPGERVSDQGLVQRRFRELIVEAHPDHGGDSDDAAQRIADLREARRILLT